MPTRRLVRSLACAALLSGATALSGPSASAQPVQPAPVPPAAARPFIAQTLAFNPLAVPFGVVSGEYERALGRGGFAVGAGGFAAFTDAGSDNIYLASSGERWASLEAKLKYYPAQNGLRGFAVGLTAGVIRASRPTYDYTGGCYSVCALDSDAGGYGVLVGRESFVTPTLGTTLDYNFFLGPKRRFLVGIGTGARRALRVDSRLGPIPSTQVDARLQVGIGF